MKTNNQLNIKVDDRLLNIINQTTNDLDCSLSEFIRTCIEVGAPIIQTHPDLLRLLPFRASNEIKKA
jgi:hypothetical protein